MLAIGDLQELFTEFLHNIPDDEASKGRNKKPETETNRFIKSSAS